MGVGGDAAGSRRPRTRNRQIGAVYWFGTHQSIEAGVVLVALVAPEVLNGMDLDQV